MKSVALLVVSNQFFLDEKHYKICKFLLDQLRSINYDVEKISFVREEENIVTHELIFLAKEFDFIIIVNTGLNANVVFNALGNICNEKLVKQSQFSNNFSDHESEEQYDKNLYPLSTRFLKLNDSNKSDVISYLGRIFIMEGEPVENLFNHLLKDHLQQYQNVQIFKKKFQIIRNKVTLESSLEISNEFEIDIGNKEIEMIQLEKSDFDAIVDDEITLRQQFGDRVKEDCDIDRVMQRIINSKEEHISAAIKTIEKCLETYGLDNVFLTFNGGKDCTVLLHLLNIVKQIKYPDYREPLFCLYVRDNDTFPEQDKFVAQCQVFYNLDILSLSMGMKEALGELLKRKSNMKACFLGTRRTDPHSANLTTFQMTDATWPSIMRVNPLLDWHYSDIWNFLLFYKVPYCKLYDQGYTSLGSASSTVRNPSLLHNSIKHGKEIYLPAYKLLNEAEERTGRDDKKK